MSPLADDVTVVVEDVIPVRIFPPEAGALRRCGLRKNDGFAAA